MTKRDELVEQIEWNLRGLSLADLRKIATTTEEFLGVRFARWERIILQHLQQHPGGLHNRNYYEPDCVAMLAGLPRVPLHILDDVLNSLKKKGLVRREIDMVAVQDRWYPSGPPEIENMHTVTGYDA